MRQTYSLHISPFSVKLLFFLFLLHGALDKLRPLIGSSSLLCGWCDDAPSTHMLIPLSYFWIFLLSPSVSIGRSDLISPCSPLYCYEFQHPPMADTHKVLRALLSPHWPRQLVLRCTYYDFQHPLHNRYNTRDGAPTQLIKITLELPRVALHGGSVHSDPTLYSGSVRGQGCPRESVPESIVPPYPILSISPHTFPHFRPISCHFPHTFPYFPLFSCKTKIKVSTSHDRAGM